MTDRIVMPEEDAVFGHAILDGGEEWWTVTLGNLLPMWGEGDTRHAAMKSLAGDVWWLHNELHGEPDERLAPHLVTERDFLCGLATAFGGCDRPLR